MRVYVSPSAQEGNIGYGNYGTEEQRMNEIADILCPLLKFNSIEVFRNTLDMTVSQMAADSNSKDVDLHIAIHSNAFDGKTRGCEVWHYPNSTGGKAIAQFIYDELEPLTPSTDRGLKTTKNFTELAKTKAPACLIEIAFHDNPEDAVWIIQNKQLIAEAIAKGVCKYWGLTFKNPKTTVNYKKKYEDLVAGIKKLLGE